jgi:predicted metal-dependent phosphoesterase TrpH
MELCDLHVHSVYSDGTFTPTEIVKRAKEVGLKAVALTDHNTALGLKEFKMAGVEFGVETICGLEFSADYVDREVHIVALFIKEEDHDKIEEFLDTLTKRKIESNLKLVAGLKSIGMEIDFDTLVKEAPSGKINRANIGAELVRLNYVKSVKEAFDTVLSKTFGLYIEPKRPTAEETIKFINSIGAVPILAHPILNFDFSEIKNALLVMKEAGLKGVETNYSTYTNEERDFITSLANKLNLLKSGGSDFHGENKPDILLGKGKGKLKVPYEFLEEIKKDN